MDLDLGVDLDPGDLRRPQAIPGDPRRSQEFPSVNAVILMKLSSKQSQAGGTGRQSQAGDTVQ